MGCAAQWDCVLLAWALLLHPLLAGLAGRPWTQAEIVGLASDPTAIATLGLLLLLRGPRWPMRALWAVPLAWCAAQRRHLVDHGLGARLGAGCGGAAGARGGPAWLMRCTRRR